MIEPITIPLSHIYISPNALKNYNKDAYETNLETLASNIQQYGLLNPLTVHASPDRAGMYEVVIGRRRFMALHKLGWNEAPCRVISSQNDKDIMLINLAEDVQRCSTTVQEKCAAIHKLYMAHKKDIGAVKNLTNLSVNTLKRYININKNLTPTLYAMFNEKGDHRLTVDVADLLVKAVPHKAKQKKALRIMYKLKTNRERKMVLGKVIQNPQLSLESIVLDITKTYQQEEQFKFSTPWIPDPQNKPHPIPKQLYSVIYELVRNFE